MARQATANEAAESRLSRRSALRAGAVAGALGAGLAAGTRGGRLRPRTAAAATAHTLHLEVDTVVLNGVIFSRDGGVAQSGVPRQQGDHCNVAWSLHAIDQADGEQIGDWHCIGPWVGSTKEKGAPGGAFLVTAQFELYGRGKLSGLVYCSMGWNDGTVTGGTGEFHAASGSFRWGPLAGSVSRIQFDLILPNVG